MLFREYISKQTCIIVVYQIQNHDIRHSISTWCRVTLIFLKFVFFLEPRLFLNHHFCSGCMWCMHFESELKVKSRQKKMYAIVGNLMQRKLSHGRWVYKKWKILLSQHYMSTCAYFSKIIKTEVNAHFSVCDKHAWKHTSGNTRYWRHWNKFYFVFIVFPWIEWDECLVKPDKENGNGHTSQLNLTSFLLGNNVWREIQDRDMLQFFF